MDMLPDLPPALYLVATPIGHLRDITLRALDVLASVDAVACEDTRVTGRLLQAYGLSRPLILYNDHSDDSQRKRLVSAVENGQRIALVSDAGTPLVSDPGYKLVQCFIAQGLTVTAVPGPSAALTALQLSGLPTDRFLFAGFAPLKSAARRRFAQTWRGCPATLILFETGPRLAESLRDMAAIMGEERPAAVARELTKMFEEIRRDSLAALAEYYEINGAPKGEMVVVIGPPPDEPPMTDERLDARLTEALARLRLREAVDAVTRETGQARRRVYARALALSKPEPDG